MITLLQCRKGAAAVEFALIVPLLLTFSLGIAEFGLMVNQKMRLESAARAGAQAAFNSYDLYSVDNSSVSQAVQLASGLDASQITISVATSCGCADGSTAVCGVSCADGSVQREYVTVTVNRAYQTLFDYPGLGSQIPLSAQATLRAG